MNYNSELEAILDNIDQTTIIKLIKKIFKGTKFTTIERETVTGVDGGVKLHFTFLDGSEIVSPLIYELTDVDVEVLKQKVAELETKIADHLTRIEALEGKTDDLQDDIDAIRTIVNQLSTDLTALTTRVTNAENRLSSAELDINVLKNDVNTLGTSKADKTELPVANNGEATTGTLDTLKVDGVNYKVDGGGTGTDDYNNLNNKPTIDGVELRQGTTHSELGLLGQDYKATTDQHLDEHDQDISTLEVDVANLQNGKADKTELPEANNGEATTDDLATLKVRGVNYKIPSGSGDKYYIHSIKILPLSTSTLNPKVNLEIINKTPTPFTYDTLKTYIVNHYDNGIGEYNKVKIATGIARPAISAPTETVAGIAGNNINECVLLNENNQYIGTLEQSNVRSITDTVIEIN